MLTKVIRDCVLLTCVGAALIEGWTHRPQVYEFLGLPAPVDAQAAIAGGNTVNAMPMVSAAPQTSAGSTVTLFKANDGHF